MIRPILVGLSAVLMVLIVMLAVQGPNNKVVADNDDNSPEVVTPVVPEEPSPEPEKPKPLPPPTNYNEALEQSKQTGKKIVLYFTAPAWCPPCQKMESTTLPNENVKKALEPFIFYKIDTDGSEKTVASKWKIRAVPTYLITSHAEKMERSASGYKSPEGFIAWLQGDAQTYCKIQLEPVQTNRTMRWYRYQSWHTPDEMYYYIPEE